MIIEILIALLLGVSAGTITGLIPGIHVNLISLLVFAFSVFLLQHIAPFTLVVFIVAMAITHTFLNFIPSIFLGAPDSDTALSVLPGHRLLLKGKGYEAVKLTLFGSYGSLLLLIAISPFFIFFLPKIYPFIQQYIPFILLLASAFLIAKDRKKFWSFFLFLLSGVLGFATLNLLPLKQPLLPLLTGLFGCSMLSISFVKKVTIPKQKITSKQISKKELKTAFSSSLISGPLCSFLPGLGAAQAAVLGSSFSKLSEKGFLVLLGAINTLVMGLSFTTLYTISRARSGAAVFSGKLLSEFTLNHLIVLLPVVLIAGSFSVFLTLAFSRLFAKNVEKINYPKLCTLMIIFLFAINFFLSGPYSLLVLITATALGVTALELGVKKMHLMGCLILPIVIFFLL